MYRKLMTFMALTFMVFGLTQPQTASAVTINPGDLIAEAAINLNGNASFSDIYTYTTNVTQLAYSGVALNSQGENFFGVRNLTLTWTDLSNFTLATLIVTDVAGKLIDGATHFVTTAIGAVYNLTVSGTTLSKGGIYNFTIQAGRGDIPGVPVPAAGLLLISALGGLAAFARRRKSI